METLRFTDKELIGKLRYQGKQYSNGQTARGGGIEEHYLTQAANRLEALTADAEAKLASAEPVATLLGPDPYDERTGFYLSLEDRGRLSKLPAGTRLFTEAQPAPDVQAAVDAALEKAAHIVKTYQVSIGNSPAGEIACQMTMDNIKEIHDAIRAIPRDSSALDEYKADILRMREQFQHFIDAKKDGNWPDFNADDFMLWCKSRSKFILENTASTDALDKYVAERNSDIKRLLDILVCANSATNNGDGGFYFDVIAELKAKYNLP